MPRKRKLAFEFGFGIQEGADENQLLVPQLTIAKNIKFRKQNSIESREPYSLEKHLNKNIIKSERYIDEVFLLSPTEIFSYRNKSISKVGNYFNGDIEDIFAEFGSESTLEPHINVVNNSIDIVFKTSQNIFYKRLNKITKNVEINAKSIMPISGNPGDSPRVFFHKGIVLVSYIDSGEIKIAFPLTENANPLTISTGYTKIDAYEVTTEEDMVTIKVYNHTTKKEKSITFTINSIPEISDEIDTYVPSYFRRTSDVGNFNRFNFWSDVTFDGNVYQIYWNSVGYYMVDGEENIVAKFYSDKTPPINTNGVSFHGKAVSIGEDEVMLPFIISNNQTSPTFGINILRIKLDKENFLGSFSENLLEYFMSGSILQNYDGSKFLEHGFNEDPEIDVQIFGTDVIPLLDSTAIGEFEEATSSEVVLALLNPIDFSISGLINPIELTNDITLKNLVIQRNIRKLSLVYKQESVVPSDSLVSFFSYQDREGGIKSISTSISDLPELLIGSGTINKGTEEIEGLPGTPQSLGVSGGDFIDTITLSGGGVGSFNLISGENEIRILDSNINSSGNLESIKMVSDLSLENINQGFSEDLFVIFAENEIEMFLGNAQIYNLRDKISAESLEGSGVNAIQIETVDLSNSVVGYKRLNDSDPSFRSGADDFDDPDDDEQTFERGFQRRNENFSSSGFRVSSGGNRRWDYISSEIYPPYKPQGSEDTTIVNLEEFRIGWDVNRNSDDAFIKFKLLIYGFFTKEEVLNFLGLTPTSTIQLVANGNTRDIENRDLDDVDTRDLDEYEGWELDGPFLDEKTSVFNIDYRKDDGASQSDVGSSSFVNAFGRQSTLTWNLRINGVDLFERANKNSYGYVNYALSSSLVNDVYKNFDDNEIKIHYDQAVPINLLENFVESGQTIDLDNYTSSISGQEITYSAKPEAPPLTGLLNVYLDNDFDNPDLTFNFSPGVSISLSEELTPVLNKVTDPEDKDFNFKRFVKAYTFTTEIDSESNIAATGSQTIDPTTLFLVSDGTTVPPELSSYEYNKNTNTLSITLSTALNFNRFKIYNSDGEVIISLLGSEATFTGTTYSWTLASDPITETGTYSFVITTDSGSFALKKTVINTDKTITYDVFNLEEEDNNNIPSYSNLASINSTLGILSPASWFSEEEDISSRSFNFNNLYEVESIRLVFSNNQVIVKFSSDLTDDINIEGVRILIEAQEGMPYIYSYKSKSLNTITFDTPVDEDGSSTIIDNPPGFSDGTSQNFTLKVLPPVDTQQLNLPDKKYSYFCVYEWTDNKGLVHFSNRSLADTITNKGAIGDTGTINPTVKIKALNLTGKKDSKIVIYRTEAELTTHRKITSIDNPINDVEISFVDNVKDENLEEPFVFYGKQVFQPPAGPISAIFRNRIFIAGFKEFTNRMVASEERNISSNATIFDKATNDSLNLYFDHPIVGLATMDSHLIIFTKKGAYAYGPDGSVSLITGLQSYDLLSHQSVVSFSEGIIFQSSHGIHHLNRGLSTQYIGINVLDFNSKKIVEAKVNEAFHEIFFVFDDNSTLVYNYFYKQWSEGIAPVKTLFFEQNKDIHRIIDSTNRIYVSDVNSSDEVTSLIETGFFNLEGNAQGYIRVDEGFLLGNFGSYSRIRIMVAYDWNEGFEDEHEFFAPERVSPQENISSQTRYGAKDAAQNQISFAIKKPKTSSIKLRIMIESNKAVISNIAFVIKASSELSKLLPSQRG